jgi:molybdopterin-guanine dinucleotide biosynthesis protein B
MNKPFILGFYGKSNIGKTTLILRIIKELSAKGLNIASIKITDKKIGFDKVGKDTWKYAEYGSKFIILSSKNETDYIIKQKHTINQIVENISNFDEVDIILVEGAFEKDIPKIRLGDIELRENTVYTYDEDFNSLLNIIKHMADLEE